VVFYCTYKAHPGTCVWDDGNSSHLFCHRVVFYCTHKAHPGTCVWDDDNSSHLFATKWSSIAHTRPIRAHVCGMTIIRVTSLPQSGLLFQHHTDTVSRLVSSPCPASASRLTTWSKTVSAPLISSSCVDGSVTFMPSRAYRRVVMLPHGLCAKRSHHDATAKPCSMLGWPTYRDNVLQ
jgi:hypothetical protein